MDSAINTDDHILFVAIYVGGIAAYDVSNPYEPIKIVEIDSGKQYEAI